ncbi:MAG TPA: isochorismatase family protein [Thermomicrobiales bacterium]|nr:isochorismatase family protein [Thermomicrobiales bacterium]
MIEDFKVRGGNTALVVIDVQVGVVADGWDRDGVVDRIGKIIDAARESVTPVIYVQHESPDYPPMAPGGEAWHIVPEIAPLDGEPVVAKRYPDAFVDTILADTLADLGVGHLIVTGAQSDACVRATSYRALASGYDVTLVADAHTTSDLEHEGIEIPARVTIAHVNAAAPWIDYPDTTSRVVSTAEALASFAAIPEGV